MLLNFEDFSQVFAENGINISTTLYDRFSIYAKMLVEYNKKCNLTAILDPKGIAEKHFLDSVLPFKYFELSGYEKLIDVGTGAGFPSIPLRILHNNLEITLLDSLKKRLNFLDELLNTLCISGELVHGRAEDFGNNADFREKFDIATARAVANLTVLSEYCMPFVKVGGHFVALKGNNGEEEVKNARIAIQQLGGEIENVFNYSLPGGDNRVLIVIKKISQTPTKFPRNKSQMLKKPL